MNDGSSTVMLELGQASLHLDLSCPGVGSIGCTGAIQNSEGRFQLATRSVKKLKKKIEKKIEKLKQFIRVQIKHKQEH